MAMNTTKMTSRYFVSGRVQGVGYRHWAIRRARSLGLIGWIRNRRDGRVEILAYGEKDMLDDLERELAGGPPAADVADVQVAPVTPEEAEQVARATGFEQISTE